MASQHTGSCTSMPEDTSGEPTAPDGTADGPRHAAPDGAPPHPLIDLTRDPTPGVPNHAIGEAGDTGQGFTPVDD